MKPTNFLLSPLTPYENRWYSLRTLHASSQRSSLPKMQSSSVVTKASFSCRCTALMTSSHVPFHSSIRIVFVVVMWCNLSRLFVNVIIETVSMAG